MTDERWRRILQMVNETFEDYLSGMAGLRRRVVVDLRRKLRHGQVLGRSRLEQPFPRERPTSAAHQRRAKGCRKRRS